MYKTEKEISSGGVVCRLSGGAWQVLLFSKKKGTLWCLPKGKIEKNETMEQAALREVKEETGVEAVILGRLNDIHYCYVDTARNLRLNKTVHFFLMKYKDSCVVSSDPEVESVEWFMIDDAINKSSYDSERKTVQKAKVLLSTRKGNTDEV